MAEKVNISFQLAKKKFRKDNLYRPDSYAAKMTTNFRPNFKPKNAKKKPFTIMAVKVGVFLRSVNAARNSKSSNVLNRP
jgi:hypothetical protein